jgi:hypothetical protein
MTNYSHNFNRIAFLYLKHQIYKVGVLGDAVLPQKISVEHK